MRYNITVISDTNKREHNEDNFFYTGIECQGKKYILALVCDGMGGLDSGEVASLLAVETAKKFFTEEVLSLKTDALKKKIKEYVSIVDEKARKISDETDESLGTTLTLLILSEGRFLTANIGDSRIYKINNRVMPLTKDQTVYQRELDTKIVDNSIPIGKKKSTLLQCIGSGISPTPVFTEGDYSQNDWFLLCSDGLHNRVNEREMLSFKDGCEDNKEVLENLVKLVKEKGERDNITGIIIQVF